MLLNQHQLGDRLPGSLLVRSTKILRMPPLRTSTLRATGLTFSSPTYRFSILTSQQVPATRTTRTALSHQHISTSSSLSGSSSTPHSSSDRPPSTTSTTAHPATFRKTSHSQSRSFSSTPRVTSGGHSSEDSFDPPGGWLFGVPPGEKYQNEGWERVWTWGMGTCIVVAVVGYAYKPDTRYV